MWLRRIAQVKPTGRVIRRAARGGDGGALGRGTRWLRSPCNWLTCGTSAKMQYRVRGHCVQFLVLEGAIRRGLSPVLTLSAIPSECIVQPLVVYLTRDELRTMLDAPDRHTVTVNDGSSPTGRMRSDSRAAVSRFLALRCGGAFLLVFPVQPAWHSAAAESMSEGCCLGWRPGSCVPCEDRSAPTALYLP